MSCQAMERKGQILNTYYKAKKPICKGCIINDSNCVTFWKRQNYGESKIIGGCQGGGEEG